MVYTTVTMNISINNYKFKIISCKDTDYWFVCNLLKRNMFKSFVKHWGGWKPKVFRKDFNKNNIRIVKYKTKRIAFYDLEFKKNFSYINNIQISNLMQGKGLGNVLMDLIEKETQKQKLNKIRLEVFKDNLAIKFYQKLGYKQIKDKGSSVLLEKKI